MLPQTRARRRVGRQTVSFARPPLIVSTAALGGPMEGQGQLGHRLDVVYDDTLLGEKSWERAECRMLCDAVELACSKAGHALSDIDVLVAGDLLDEIIVSNFAARDLDIPYLGVFGACSALTEAMGLAAMMVDAGYAVRAVAAVSSHHDTAERQYRFPTEFAAQRPPSAQWTVTGAAAMVLHPGGAEADGDPGPNGSSTQPRITHATFGRVVDMGMKDPFDMGSAMAPAAADTIRQHLDDLDRSPDDYDLIITGDLAGVGRPLAAELLRDAGYDLSAVLDDCGLRIYGQRQQVDAGASGCASSGLVFTAQIYHDLVFGRLGRVLIISTGALISKTSYQQGESIPGLAHAVCVEAGPGAAGRVPGGSASRHRLQRGGAAGAGSGGGGGDGG